MIRNVSIPYIKVEDNKKGNLHAFEAMNAKWVLQNIVRRKHDIF
jgi:hypothetical protein